MEIAIILSVIISVLSIYLKSQLILILQVLPLFILYNFMMQFSKKYERVLLYMILGLSLFIFALAMPFILSVSSFGAVGNLSSSINFIFYSIIAILVIFIVLKFAALNTLLPGKVVLADNTKAVVWLDFDLLLGIKAGEYVVENNNAKKGDIVRVKIEKRLFKKQLMRVVK